MFPSRIVFASTSLLVLGCQGGDPPAPAPRTDPAVTVRDPGGATVLEARLVEARCEVSGEASLAVARDGDTVRAGTALSFGPGRTGNEVAGADGAMRLRVHRAAGEVGLIDPQGIPIVRIIVDDASARIVDAARTPIARLAREGGRITVTASAGAALAYVAGTTDLEVAALLVAPGVDADTRALLACERLLPRHP
jgi:hypothetical protein